MPLPGQTPEGPEGKYSPIQMAEWLIAEAAAFKSPQDLLDEMGRQGFEMAPAEAPMADPMMEEPPMEEPMMEEPGEEEPMEMPPEEGESPKKGKKGPAFLEMIRIEAAGKAVDKDKKNKEKADKEKEEY